MLIEELLSAPAGVAVLARLESEQRSDVAPFEAPSDHDPVGVRRAADSLGARSFGDFVALTLTAAEDLAGP